MFSGDSISDCFSVVDHNLESSGEDEIKIVVLPILLNQNLIRSELAQLANGCQFFREHGIAGYNFLIA